jgi:hypothetical protein
MTTAYNRIDRILREKLSDDDYSTYKEELEAICQAKIQRLWVGLTDEDINEWTPEIHSVIQAIEAKLKHKNGYAEEKNT